MKDEIKDNAEGFQKFFEAHRIKGIKNLVMAFETEEGNIVTINFEYAAHAASAVSTTWVTKRNGKLDLTIPAEATRVTIDY